jgi:hypothetical protein
MGLTMGQTAAVTKSPSCHFFGYYGINPWNLSETRLVGLEVDIQYRPPGPADRAKIGEIEAESRGFARIAETGAWNFQQGCMLHWLNDDEMIYNDREGDRFISRILDIESGDSRQMHLPVSAVSSDGRSALSLNFSRIHSTRPGYGYPGGSGANLGGAHPGDDGVFFMDLETGESHLAVSMDRVFGFDEHGQQIGDAVMWFNHTLFNPSGKRFIFLSRYPPGSSRNSALFTSDPDGSDLRCLIDYGLVSHFDWMDDRRLLVWADIQDEGPAFYLVEDDTGDYRKIGEGILTRDGHCSFSPDREWVLTDTYPNDKGFRKLMAFHLNSGNVVPLGNFYSDPELTGEIRCDLHPRWSRDGSRICFDSTHEKNRQIYVLDFDY